ncbi:hypothetical protein BJV82DRAFT_624552 [Fennellomyces sp. T-0311]|nr:hypothetical protein BJV82DRAFT_624552 [Fennellomyces sp. T-0311]
MQHFPDCHPRRRTSLSSQCSELSSTSDSNPIFDLQDLVQQYKSQPELLKLILQSKVEEDKRRAEEAKLRIKELDLYLKEKHIPSKRRISSSSSSDESVDHRRRNSAAFAMVAMQQQSPSPSSPPASPSSSYPSPDSTYNTKEDEDEERPRKRREMQAITKIVETRDFPYQDDYFWKNNGNTTQKKTGCKSIYYKCSNSNKGCPVNKTVTARPNGEYLIKYRGNHLPECGRVERVRDI